MQRPPDLESSFSRAIPPLAVWAQYLLPRRLLTQAFGFLAQTRLKPVSRWMIRRFIRRYGVAMLEATNPDPASYTSFNAFFTRALRSNARPLAQAPLVCPVDGAASQFGRVQQGQLLQAKGQVYDCADLLGDEAQDTAVFENGYYACLYLSPKDYHRVHMPCAGTLRHMRYIPGTLFSVSPLTAHFIPRLFARNERVVCWFETDFGPLAMVLVGATIVGSIATAWHGIVTPPRRGQVCEWTYPRSDATCLGQGQTMGHFQLGSTVIWLLPKQAVEQTLVFNPAWQPASTVRVGQSMLEYEEIKLHKQLSQE